LSSEDTPELDGALERLPVEALWPLRAGRRAARDELVRRNLPLARRLAARYRNPHEPYDDLVQVASLGLLKAVDRFDPEFGRPFSSFATPTILGELRRHFRDTGWSAHVPRGAQELALRVQKVAGELTDRHGRSPTVTEIARELEVELEPVLQALEASRAHYATSMDAPTNASEADDSEPLTLHDQTGVPDTGYSLVETSTSLAAGIARLPFIEREAITLRLQDDLTQSEIAERLGCSQMQVSRLLRRAAHRLAPAVDGDASVSAVDENGDEERLRESGANG
jgi:RNA polymerase sigma-B factor